MSRAFLLPLRFFFLQLIHDLFCPVFIFIYQTSGIPSQLGERNWGEAGQGQGRKGEMISKPVYDDSLWIVLFLFSSFVFFCVLLFQLPSCLLPVPVYYYFTSFCFELFFTWFSLGKERGGSKEEQANCCQHFWRCPSCRYHAKVFLTY
jgi:hypothetical protein